jgi:hypothetical protein
MQWIQATSAIYYCNLAGVSLAYNDLDLGGARAEMATWCSMAAVVVMAMGMRAVLHHWSGNWSEQARHEARLIRTGRALVVYLLALGFSAVVGAVAPHIPRLTQPLMALGIARWVLVFLFAYAVIETRRHYFLLALVVALEVVIGFTGFFADFKSIFFVLLVVLSGGSLALKGWRFVVGIVLAGLLIFLGLVWTAVKTDYRQALNQGSQEQRVLVPLGQRLVILLGLTRSIGPTELESAAEDMALRLSACKFFALTMENVPTYVPYEHGALWWGAIKQTIMPRLLFPRKREIYDSLEASYYTGEDVAGPEAGNSMGIGYCAESYVDFGPVGMFLPVFLLGVYYGWIYRAFVTLTTRKIFAFSIVASLMFSCAFALETTNNILLGRVMIYSLAMAIFVACCGNPVWEFLTATVKRR